MRAVEWKDFGGRKRSRKGLTGANEQGSAAANKGTKEQRKPVVLATGSFDANVGIWVWNDDRRTARFRDDGEDAPQRQNAGNVAGASESANGVASGGGDGDDSTMTDMLHDHPPPPTSNASEADEEEEEEWHFSTLLTGPDSEIKSIAFSPPHYPTNLLATSSRDKSVWIWEEVEPEEWETIAVLSEHTGDVKCVGWCAGARKGRGIAKRGRVVNANGKAGDGDVEMGEEQPSNSEGNGDRTQETGEEDDEDEDTILGSRDILASGSYDDTIRLWRDVEEEGDWICVAVIDSHEGTVWDVKWEPHINYDSLDFSTTPQPSSSPSLPPATASPSAQISSFENDWEPRILSCSDDLSVRVFRRELSESEKAKKRERANESKVGTPMGFASSRLPSVIRPPSSLETWKQESVLPQVHVRSVYAVDWSRNTGLVVSCGGDGAIAVYKEVPVTAAGGDVDMNGASAGAGGDRSGTEGEVGEDDGSAEYRLHKMQWVLVALMEASHDEYEVNHVCWAERRDRDRRFDGEEVIVSTGDEGDVRIWTLPDHLISDQTS